MDEKKNNAKNPHGKPTRGVSCDVKECSYHDGKNTCTAGEISVGPAYAQTGSETVCATFKPKEFNG
ncbi:MAG: DUF1540 domain-containing protein [Clostridia bacterium]|nr:DUF1540 domain-containing protein [Clostridia bacterium]